MIFGFIMTFIFGFSQVAYAQEESLAERLIDVLVEKKILDREEANRLLGEAKKEVIKEPEKEPPLPEGELIFDFTSPELAPPPSESEKPSGELFKELNFGGTFDTRFSVVGDDIPGEIIHINELVLTTNIGDHISFLGEWLLQTDDFINNVGDDHGFAYAIISDLPYLPRNTSIKIGRFRIKYGIDAVLDAPLNPLYTQIKKNLGFASDIGLEVEGYLEGLDLEYTFAVLNGPNAIKKEVFDSSGNSLGFIKKHRTNNSKPVLILISRKFSWLDDLRLGFSFFEGRSWPFINGLNSDRNMREPIGVNGGAIDSTQLIYKRRSSIDFSYRIEPIRLNLSGEFTFGKDFGDDGGEVLGYFVRTDRAIFPNKLDFQGQFDYWDDGRSYTDASYDIGVGLKYSFTDVAFVRLSYIFNSETDADYVLQVYLPF